MGTASGAALSDTRASLRSLVGLSAAERKDSFGPYDDLLAAKTLDHPWTHVYGTPPGALDHHFLGQLATIPVSAGAASESGSFANGIDVWISHELRRAGFGVDEVWPRPVRPRVLPRDLAGLLERLPVMQRDDPRAG